MGSGTLPEGKTNPSVYYAGVGVDSFESPQLEGYDFVGWYQKYDYTGDEVKSILASDAGDKVLYAKWTANSSESDDTSDNEDSDHDLDNSDNEGSNDALDNNSDDTTNNTPVTLVSSNGSNTNADSSSSIPSTGDENVATLAPFFTTSLISGASVVFLKLTTKKRRKTPIHQ